MENPHPWETMPGDSVSLVLRHVRSIPLRVALGWVQVLARWNGRQNAENQLVTLWLLCKHRFAEVRKGVQKHRRAQRENRTFEKIIANKG